jgi:hypothetical protein
MRAAGVGAPMLCLCTTLGQDGLTARLLVVRSERLPSVGETLASRWKEKCPIRRQGAERTRKTG